MGDGKRSDTAKARKPWAKPVLQRIELSEEERAALRASDNPMALLLKMKARAGRTEGEGE